MEPKNSNGSDSGSEEDSSAGMDGNDTVILDSGTG